MKVALIGSAGRRFDEPKLNFEVYKKMYKAAKDYIKNLREEFPGEDIIAVSGGAAYADHIAISLYLGDQIEYLDLYLPCKFDMENVCFVDDGSRDFVHNPGGTANYYHKLFSRKAPQGRNTMLGIKRAIEKGANVVVGNGFKDRNKRVAQVDHMLAFTFGAGDTPKDGSGTLHAWNCTPISCTKVHIPIDSLL